MGGHDEEEWQEAENRHGDRTRALFLPMHSNLAAPDSTRVVGVPSDLADMDFEEDSLPTVTPLWPRIARPRESHGGVGVSKLDWGPNELAAEARDF